MLNNSLKVLPFTVMLLISHGAMAQGSQGLETLFTTPAERQLINANRYKNDNQPVKAKNDLPEPSAVRELIKEEVKMSYSISGISINMDGSRVAWINGQVVENGARMDDGSKLRINDSDVKSVSITTPDGKKYTGTSGDTLDVKYMRAIEE